MANKNNDSKIELKKKEIGQRLRILRESKNLSQTQLAREIQKFDCEIVLDGENGKQTISQLENGARKINWELADAYCRIFDTTLDYLYCRTNDRKPNYASLKSTLGLDDMTLHSLESIKKYKNKANNNSEAYKYGYEVTKRIEAFNYLIQNACKEFVVNDSGEVNFEKGLLDNIYTYIFSGIEIDEETILPYTETTVCKDEFCVKEQRVKLKQLILLEIQENLINLRNKEIGENKK